jgi:pimeloyl-ACP methyl ester carboxylesterase
MSTYVLVHGGWHGAWCWQRVAPLLRAAGHRVVAPDLPGHGADATPLAAVTPGSDVQRVSAVLETLAEPAILVGHSSGGMVISAVAERQPDRVRGLVYLAAFLLPPGATPPGVMRDDTEAILASSLVVDELHHTVTVRDEALKEVFYGDCSDEDVAWARARLVPEPLRAPGPPPTAPAPPLTALRPPPAPSIPAAALAPPPAPSIPAAAAALPPGAPGLSYPPARAAELPPRFYVETLLDRALGPAAQRRMYLARPCRKVYSLPTSHSPFLSAPAALADCLLDVDRSLGSAAPA